MRGGAVSYRHSPHVIVIVTAVERDVVEVLRVGHAAAVLAKVVIKIFPAHYRGNIPAPHPHYALQLSVTAGVYPGRAATRRAGSRCNELVRSQRQERRVILASYFHVSV